MAARPVKTDQEELLEGEVLAEQGQIHWQQGSVGNLGGNYGELQIPHSEELSVAQECTQSSTMEISSNLLLFSFCQYTFCDKVDGTCYKKAPGLLDVWLQG